MSNVAGPAGEITKRRDPNAPSVSGTATTSVAGGATAILPPPGPIPPSPHESAPRGREDRDRQKGGARRDLRRKDIAWRQSAMYVGDLSATAEVGLVSPAVSGLLFTRVTCRVRTTVPLSASDYWTLGVYWRDAVEGHLIGELVFDTFEMTANTLLEVFHDEAGVRIEANDEVTVQLTKNGSAPALVGLMLYPDWYVKP